MIDDEFLFLLLCMDDLYAHKCTKQYEKFRYYEDKIKWSWEDCQAAHEILMETGAYYHLRWLFFKGIIHESLRLKFQEDTDKKGEGDV